MNLFQRMIFIQIEGADEELMVDDVAAQRAQQRLLRAVGIDQQQGKVELVDVVVVPVLLQRFGHLDHFRFRSCHGRCRVAVVARPHLAFLFVERVQRVDFLCLTSTTSTLKINSIF